MATAVLLAAASTRAAANEWRYCLGIAAVQQKIYLSEPFLAEPASANFEMSFGQALDINGAAHDSVQCPRSDTVREALEMRAYTIQYNRQRGTAVVPFAWRPVSGSAGR
jgi:hypothetical protein